MINREQNGVKQHHDINMQQANLLQMRLLPNPWSGEGVLPYIRHVLTERVWLLPDFGLKMGIDFAHLSVESGVVFEENTGMYEHIYHFSSK